MRSNWQPDLAVGNGREHLVSKTSIAGMPSTVLYHSRAAGTSTWSSSTTITGAASWAPPKIAYTRSDNTFWLAQSSGFGLSWTSTQATTHPATSFDLAMDAAGLVYIAYYLPATRTVRVDTWSGAVRQATAEADAPGGAGPGFSGISIALDAQGFAHVSLLDFTRGPVLRYSTNRTGTFVPATVTTCDDVLGQTSIAIDAMGAPHISFPSPASSFGNLGYAVKR